jgi:hypothetical protein
MTPQFSQWRPACRRNPTNQLFPPHPSWQPGRHIAARQVCCGAGRYVSSHYSTWVLFREEPPCDGKSSQKRGSTSVSRLFHRCRQRLALFCPAAGSESCAIRPMLKALERVRIPRVTLHLLLGHSPGRQAGGMAHPSIRRREGVEKGAAATGERCGVAKGAQSTPFATPASFPHLHHLRRAGTACPQAQVCAVAELERAQRLACFSTLSPRVLGFCLLAWYTQPEMDDEAREMMPWVQ